MAQNEAPPLIHWLNLWAQRLMIAAIVLTPIALAGLSWSSSITVEIDKMHVREATNSTRIDALQQRMMNVEQAIVTQSTQNATMNGKIDETNAKLGIITERLDSILRELKTAR